MIPVRENSEVVIIYPDIYMYILYMINPWMTYPFPAMNFLRPWYPETPPSIQVFQVQLGTWRATQMVKSLVDLYRILLEFSGLLHDVTGILLDFLGYFLHDLTLLNRILTDFGRFSGMLLTPEKSAC